MSNGEASSRKIGAIVGLHHTIVSEYWKEWLLLGLGETISASGGSKFIKSFDLEMCGISSPVLSPSKEISTTQSQKVETNEG